MCDGEMLSYLTMVLTLEFCKCSGRVGDVLEMEVSQVVCGRLPHKVLCFHTYLVCVSGSYEEEVMANLMANNMGISHIQVSDNMYFQTIRLFDIPMSR